MDYQGNVPYCYADSLSMLLSVHGERVRPGLIEPLTGVGLGALRVPDGRTYFSAITPPQGLDAALRLLGCDFTGTCGPDDVPVEEILREELATGPVLLGPLDMGHLTYVPWHRDVPGADHYVVAYDLDDEGVLLQDPAGFPCARLGFADLEAAWRAERVDYEHGVYQRWTRIGPPREVVYDEARAFFSGIYRDNPGAGEVIRALAADLRGPVDPATAGFLTGFTLPLGARRALDFAVLFEQGGDHRLAAVKNEQAHLFARARAAGFREGWAEAADVLTELAGCEDTVERLLLKDKPSTRSIIR
ncbi:BtrH N-terminal domain-containing protein [Saccharothrix sp. AJ9571]|nr:BtrH N-terminal domain-containing protein [Saccharothrix sp. AJ9571]